MTPRFRATARTAAYLLAGAALVLALFACAQTTAGPAAARGLKVVSSRSIGARERSIQFVSGALGGRSVNVRVLLPSDYAANPGRRYPVLYLLHGTGGVGADWLTQGYAEELTRGVPVIFVMPDASLAPVDGWYTNWYNRGRGGAPAWESFHISELIPWVDRHLRTVASRRGRAIAGASMGGFGALSYAARHPDLFTSVGAFSPVAEIATDRYAIEAQTGEIESAGESSAAGSATAVFGPRGGTHELGWQAHDPAALAPNLRDTDIHLWVGNGRRGPLDVAPPVRDTDEPRLRRLTLLFAAHLRALDIRHTLSAYGSGTHSWAYFRRDLTQYLPGLLRRFSHPPKPPARITYRTTAARFSEWGWSVSLRRRRPAFTTLGDAGRRGFALAGTGAATVLTPRFFRKGSWHRVLVRDVRGTHRARLRADGRGRLRIHLALAGRRASARIAS